MYRKILPKSSDFTFHLYLYIYILVCNNCELYYKIWEKNRGFSIRVPLSINLQIEGFNTWMTLGSLR